MKTIVKLLLKVPLKLRFALVAILFFTGGFLALNGATDGPAWQAYVGMPLFILVVVTIGYLITSKIDA